MQPAAVIRILKPNVTSLGYALFLAINAAGVWGGVFPFLPLEFQTPEIVFWFFLAQSLVFSASYFASAFGVYFLPGPTRRFMVMLAAAPYFLGWCCLIAAIYLDAWALPLVVVGGGLLGLGSAGFFMLWQRLFASFDADHGNRDLIVGTAYAAVMYFALYLIPQAVTAYLIPLVFLPLFGLAIVLKSREIDRDQPMFEDVPRDHPHVYRTVVRDYWRSAFCVGALGFCTGIMRSLAIGEPQVGALVNVLSMAGSLVAAVTVLVLWQFKNLRMNVVGAYRVVFPFVITSFLLLPFLMVAYAQWLAAILYAMYSVAIVLMMIQCAQASRDRGINPVFIYAFFGAVVYLMQAVGFLLGRVSDFVSVDGFDWLFFVAMVSSYVLGITLLVSTGTLFKAVASKGTVTADPIEFLRRGSDADERAAAPGSAKAAKSPKPKPAKAAPKRRNRPSASDDAGTIRDRTSKQCRAMQEAFGLSTRETEVMELIARGNSMASIAERLVISENTVRTHAKHIYTKLDIHKRQELLDMLHEREG